MILARGALYSCIGPPPTLARVAGRPPLFRKVPASMQGLDKERIVEMNDIVDVVGERVALKRQGRGFVGLCPFHEDHNPSMTVNPAMKIFKCWSCGAGGDVIRFIERFHHMDFKQALRLLAERVGIRVEERGGAESSEAVALLRRTMDWAKAFFRRQFEGPAGAVARDYCARRGITRETIERFELGFAPDGWTALTEAAARSGVPANGLQLAQLTLTSDKGRVFDRFRNRLIFPIQDAQGRCVAFGGRTLGDDSAKYLNSPETPLFSKSRILFGFDKARPTIGEKREVIVVEGYIDAIMLHQAGVTNVVATLGTALTESHVKLVKHLVDRVFICFDGDEAGERAADRALEATLRHGLEVRVVILPSGQDPADCILAHGAEGFTTNLHSAQDALEFKWRCVAGTVGSGHTSARRQAAEDFLRFVARVSADGGVDPLQQAFLVGRLSELLSLPPARVYERLGRLQGAAKPDRAGAESVISEASEYRAAVRGLPPGLVSAVEELFGLAIAEGANLSRVSAALGSVSGYCGAWRKLLEALEAAEESGRPLDRVEFLESCSDVSVAGLIAELPTSAPEDASKLASDCAERIRHELELLRIGTMRATVRSRDSFENLLSLRRGRNDSVPPSNRFL